MFDVKQAMDEMVGQVESQPNDVDRLIGYETLLSWIQDNHQDLGTRRRSALRKAATITSHAALAAAMGSRVTKVRRLLGEGRETEKVSDLGDM